MGETRMSTVNTVSNITTDLYMPRDGTQSDLLHHTHIVLVFTFSYKTENSKSWSFQALRTLFLRHWQSAALVSNSSYYETGISCLDLCIWVKIVLSLAWFLTACQYYSRRYEWHLPHGVYSFLVFPQSWNCSWSKNCLIDFTSSYVHAAMFLC